VIPVVHHLPGRLVIALDAVEARGLAEMLADCE
jgi:hypothetical protein